MTTGRDMKKTAQIEAFFLNHDLPYFERIIDAPTEETAYEIAKEALEKHCPLDSADPTLEWDLQMLRTVVRRIRNPM